MALGLQLRKRVHGLLVRRSVVHDDQLDGDGLLNRSHGVSDQTTLSVARNDHGEPDVRLERLLGSAGHNRCPRAMGRRIVAAQMRPATSQK